MKGGSSIRRPLTRKKDLSGNMTKKERERVEVSGLKEKPPRTDFTERGDLLPFGRKEGSRYGENDSS